LELALSHSELCSWVWSFRLISGELGYSSGVKHLPSMIRALGSIPTTIKQNIQLLEETQHPFESVMATAILWRSDCALEMELLILYKALTFQRGHLSLARKKHLSICSVSHGQTHLNTLGDFCRRVDCSSWLEGFLALRFCPGFALWRSSNTTRCSPVTCFPTTGSLFWLSFWFSGFGKFTLKHCQHFSLRGSFRPKKIYLGACREIILAYLGDLATRAHNLWITVLWVCFQSMLRNVSKDLGWLL
jgi:hypothetical protein